MTDGNVYEIYALRYSTMSAAHAPTVNYLPAHSNETTRKSSILRLLIRGPASISCRNLFNGREGALRSRNLTRIPFVIRLRAPFGVNADETSGTWLSPTCITITPGISTAVPQCAVQSAGSRETTPPGAGMCHGPCRPPFISVAVPRWSSIAFTTASAFQAVDGAEGRAVA